MNPDPKGALNQKVDRPGGDGHKTFTKTGRKVTEWQDCPDLSRHRISMTRTVQWTILSSLDSTLLKGSERGRKLARVH